MRDNLPVYSLAAAGVSLAMRGLFLFLSFFLAPALAGADEPRYPLAQWHKEVYALLLEGPRLLGPQDFANILAAPPPANSAQTKAELAELLRLQDTARTPAWRVAIVRAHQAQPEDLPELIWPDFLAAPRPALRALLAAVGDEVNFYILREKARFARLRPEQLEPRLTTVIKTPHHPAYPSGHAGQSRAVARALGWVYPGQASEFLARAAAIGQGREIAGVHFHSDTEAGEKLADAVVNELKNNPEIQKLLIAAQQEALPQR